MADYAHRAKCLARYLSAAPGMAPTLERFRHLRVLENVLGRPLELDPDLSERDRSRLLDLVSPELDRQRWTMFMRNVLESGDLQAVKKILHGAERVGIDPEPFVYEWLHSQPHERYLWSFVLGRADEAGLDLLLEQIAGVLPFDSFMTGPSDKLGFRRGSPAESCLGAVLHRLFRTPLKQGLPTSLPETSWLFIRAGLNNRVTSTDPEPSTFSSTLRQRHGPPLPQLHSETRCGSNPTNDCETRCAKYWGRPTSRSDLLRRLPSAPRFEG